MNQEELKLGFLCTSQAAAWIAAQLGWHVVGGYIGVKHGATQI